MRPLLLAIGVVLCAGSGSWSNQLQEPVEFGAIEGHVVDPDGKPVAGATIWARHEVLMRHHLQLPQTADDGSFRVDSVP